MKSKSLEQYRTNVVSPLSGTGLEIGFGTGLNLRFYNDVTKLYALEPSREIYDLAKDLINQVSFPVEFLKASAEKIPLPDSSVDFVVSTWTLCSIPHPETALKEIFRVLKPEGKFSFIDHGKSPRSFINTLQNVLTPLSKVVAGGCHLNRDIEKLIAEAGFEILTLKKFSPPSKPLAFMFEGIALIKK